MALGIRLTVAVAALTVAACSQSHSSPVEAVSPLDRAFHESKELQLVEQGQKCVLTRGEDSLSLDLPAPCRFLRRSSGPDPVIENYGEKGSVILIAGPLVPDADYVKNNTVEPADKCSNIAQAVLIRGDDLSTSEVFNDPLAYCAQIAPDEKFYYGVAHSGG